MLVRIENSITKDTAIINTDAIELISIDKDDNAVIRFRSGGILKTGMSLDALPDALTLNFPESTLEE